MAILDPIIGLPQRLEDIVAVMSFEYGEEMKYTPIRDVTACALEEIGMIL